MIYLCYQHAFGQSDWLRITRQQRTGDDQHESTTRTCKQRPVCRTRMPRWKCTPRCRTGPGTTPAYPWLKRPTPTCSSDREFTAMKGEFIRTESRFRGWVTASEGAEHSGHGDFPAAPGRYHLYVSYISAATNPSILPASCPRGRTSTSTRPISGTGSKTNFAPETSMK